ANIDRLLNKYDNTFYNKIQSFRLYKKRFKTAVPSTSWHLRKNLVYDRKGEDNFEGFTFLAYLTKDVGFGKINLNVIDETS
ncbi:MAG: hypothetical protein PHQ50_00650, partial [Eubacteriales bacterium]|nr:hypothetical protein [Eubacteriales bacterium]